MSPKSAAAQRFPSKAHSSPGLYRSQTPTNRNPRPERRRRCAGPLAADLQIRLGLCKDLAYGDARHELDELKAFGVRSMTARSVMMRSTTPVPVKGNEHSSTIL